MTRPGPLKEILCGFRDAMPLGCPTTDRHQKISYDRSWMEHPEWIGKQVSMRIGRGQIPGIFCFGFALLWGLECRAEPPAGPVESCAALSPLNAANSAAVDADRRGGSARRIASPSGPRKGLGRHPDLEREWEAALTDASCE